jgi:hypothetical protein
LGGNIAEHVLQNDDELLVQEPDEQIKEPTSYTRGNSQARNNESQSNQFLLVPSK